MGGAILNFSLNAPGFSGCKRGCRNEEVEREKRHWLKSRHVFEGGGRPILILSDRAPGSNGYRRGCRNEEIQWGRF
jgi:hypothetical protein